MAASPLTSLPTELLDEIIPHTLPEGFEGLALTCRKLHNLCTPWIERHNQLRTQFRKFTYLKYRNREGLLSVHSPPAVYLIQEIAHNPVVARYIRHADFTYDTWPPPARPTQLLPDPDLGGPVAALFAESPYLREAGLDWREYYALIQEDLDWPNRYSQPAAAFLLTLLPNVTSLKLPYLWRRPWRPCEMADKLVLATVRGAADRPGPRSSLPRDSPSLAQVTEFEHYSESGPRHLSPLAAFGPQCHEPATRDHRFDLADAVPFLALPELRSFRACSCVARDGGSVAAAFEDAGFPPGQTIEAARFVDACVDDAAMATFLRRAPNLRELVYWHCTDVQAAEDWDACRLVAAIGREAGSRLEGLEIDIWGSRVSLAPGRLSMRGFQRLRKLRLPLEIAACNLAADASARDKELTDEELGELQRLTDILVPASVSHLTLHSRDPDRHVELLRVMFRNFAARKDDWVPAIEEVRLIPAPKKDGAYKDECGRLEGEMMEAGVTLHLEEHPFDEDGNEWQEEELTGVQQDAAEALAACRTTLRDLAKYKRSIRRRARVEGASRGQE